MSVERIRKLMGQAEVLRVAHSAGQKAAQAGFDAEVQAAWKRKFPRRKFSMKASADKVKGNQPEHGEIYERWMQKVDADYKAFKVALDVVEKQIDSEALVTDIPAFEGMTIFKVVQSDSYRSQGFGMNKYALADAMDHEDKAKAYGLTTFIRKVKTYEGRDTCGYMFTYYDYEVWVSTDEIGVVILNAKPETETMADWVKKCDARFVCARVFAPFMSYDQEEQYRREAGLVTA